MYMSGVEVDSLVLLDGERMYDASDGRVSMPPRLGIVTHNERDSYMVDSAYLMIHFLLSDSIEKWEYYKLSGRLRVIETTYAKW